MDPPVIVMADSIPAGVSDVQSRLCFREIDSTSDNINHCPLGFLTFPNDNFDGEIEDLEGSENIPPAYPSSVGLLVRVTGLTSSSDQVILGMYITGRIGGEPGMLVNTCPTRAESEDGSFVVFEAVIGVRCVSGFTGPECNTSTTSAPPPLTLTPRDCPSTDELTTAVATETDLNPTTVDTVMRTTDSSTMVTDSKEISWSYSSCSQLLPIHLFHSA